MQQMYIVFDQIELQNPDVKYFPVNQNNINQKQYICVSCDKKYHAPDLLDDHMRQHNSSSEKTNMYTCQFEKCSKSFNLYSHLQRHLKNHSDKVFQCNYQNCEQTFNVKSNLKRHEKTHTKQRPFLCNECEKGFATTTNLKQHLQVHLGQNKRQIFECEINGCTKKYFYLCNLRKHKKQHQDCHQQENQLANSQFTFCQKVENCSIVYCLGNSQSQNYVLMTYKKKYEDEKLQNQQRIIQLDNDQAIYRYSMSKLTQNIYDFIDSNFKAIEQQKFYKIQLELPQNFLKNTSIREQLCSYFKKNKSKLEEIRITINTLNEFQSAIQTIFQRMKRSQTNIKQQIK